LTPARAILPAHHDWVRNMTLSRDELVKLLCDLEGAMPVLMHEYPDAADFNPAFAALADAITDNASVEDDTWVFEQIDGILERHGLWRPGQEDLPPDG
jgi:hypothetical protein